MNDKFILIGSKVINIDEIVWIQFQESYPNATIFLRPEHAVHLDATDAKHLFDYFKIGAYEVTSLNNAVLNEQEQIKRSAAFKPWQSTPQEEEE